MPDDDKHQGCNLAAISAHVQRLDERIHEMHLSFSTAVRAMIADAVSEHSLSPEQKRFVELAIQREAQSIDLRNAVIKHTTTGLIWLLLLWIGSIVLEYLRAHGWKS